MQFGFYFGFVWLWLRFTVLAALFRNVAGKQIGGFCPDVWFGCLRGFRFVFVLPPFLWRFLFFWWCLRSVVVAETSGLGSGRFVWRSVESKHPAINCFIVVGRPVHRTDAFAAGAWQGGVLARQFQPRPLQAAKGGIGAQASYRAARQACVPLCWQTRFEPWVLLGWLSAVLFGLQWSRWLCVFFTLLSLGFVGRVRPLLAWVLTALWGNPVCFVRR